MVQRIADTAGAAYDPNDLLPQERALLQQIKENSERLREIEDDPRQEGEARRLRETIKSLERTYQRSATAVVRGTETVEERIERSLRSTNHQIQQAQEYSTESNNEFAGPLPQEEEAEPIPEEPDPLLEASKQWKTDQEILFDNMINGVNLIDSSLTPVGYHFRNINPELIAGDFNPNRDFVKDPSVKKLYGSDVFIPQSKKPYKNFVKINSENSLTFVSELTKNPGVYGFLNIPSPILSFLVPRVRLYKARYETEDQKEPTLVEFVFEDNFTKSDVEAITTSARNRGSGAGIVSFNWETQGTNPFDADKLISANLNLHFQSIKDFSNVRVSNNVVRGNKILTRDETKNKYKYSELIVPSERTFKNSCDPTEEFYNEKYYQIMVDVGWAIPQNIDDGAIWDIITRYNQSSEEQLKITPALVRNTVRRMNVQMFLTSPRHGISYNQDGTVDISIDYTAYINRVIGNPQVDIFRMSDSYKEYQDKLIQFQKKKTDLDERFKTLQQQKSEKPVRSKKIEEEISQLSKELNQRRAEFKGDKIVFYNSVIQKMLDSQVVYRLDMAWQDGKNVIVGGNGNYIFPTVTLPGAFCSGEVIRGLKTQAAQIGNQSATYSVHYFFLGDLLDALYEVLYTSGVTTFKQIRPLVGSFEYYDKNNNRVSINLADLPISLNYFNLFLKREFIDPQPDRYVLDRFIQRLLGSFLFPLINNSNSEGLVNTQRFNVSMNMVNAPESRIDAVNNLYEDGATQYSGIIKEVREVPSSEGDFATPFSYLILYGVSTGSRLFLEGDYIKAEIRDKQRGIYWIRAGQGSGALKSVQFERNDIPYYREYLITKPGSNRTSNNEGNLDDVKFLKEKYNANLSFFGLPNIVPGQYIYVEPVSFGLEESRAEATQVQLLGYSGYYIVMRASHTIQNGLYETNVDARWEASGVKIDIQEARAGEDCTAELAKKTNIARGGS